ncbi:collagen-like repeat preface domain-containing protein, partial [Bacillus cereus]
MEEQSKKERHSQQLLNKHANAHPTNDSLNKKKDLEDILEDLVAAFPEGCFCQPTPETVNQIETALNDLLIWSTSAPISSGLKMKLQDVINTVKTQLDKNPFSCCDTIQTLQALVLVLLKVIAHPLVGNLIKNNLQNLTQQLQAIFVGYLACLTCIPNCETAGIFANLTQIAINDNAPAAPYPSSIEVTGLCTTITKLIVTLKNISHPTPAHIDILLVGPQGQTVILMSDAGGVTDISNVTLTFDDNALSPLPQLDQIVSGTFKPINYGGPIPDNFPAPAPAPPY